MNENIVLKKINYILQKIAYLLKKSKEVGTGKKVAYTIGGIWIGGKTKEVREMDAASEKLAVEIHAI